MATNANRLNPSEVLLLDSSLLKAPLESMKKLQRVTQKTYEYNLGPNSSFQKELNELLRQFSSSSSSEGGSTLTLEQQQELPKKIEMMLSKMRGLKRKLQDLSNQTNKVNQTSLTRLNHLASLPEKIGPEYSHWSNKRLNYQLTDYFLRSDQPRLEQTAKVFAKETGVEDLIDFELWDELNKAENGLKEHRLDQVLSWVSDNKVALRKAKSPLEFTIHLQAFIELCRTRSLNSAIAYAKRHLSSSAVAESTGTSSPPSKEMTELSKAMALLAFGPETTCQVYQHLYSPTRWDSLISLFRTTFFRVHSLPSIPLLHMSLQAGLASLKTPICCPLPLSSITPESLAALEENESRKSKDCPICSSPLGKLAPQVPYSHHVNSTIVCGLTGKVVEGGDGEGGQLLALISKTTGDASVYSKEGLALRASQDKEHRLIEPRTGEIFTFEELKKVFIS